MKCIISPYTSCYHNIASEEYYMTEFDDDIFYLYINAPSIIIGRHQNAYAEINQQYVHEKGIDVVRRLSGGGAVYHDHGNLNYGFITRSRGQDISEIFRTFTAPIVDALQEMGADARFSGRNDLVIDEKKISGVAQFHRGDKVLLHGTLLYSADMTNVSKSLNADPRKFQDKSVKSIRSRVTNISPYLNEPLSIDEFASALSRKVISRFPEAAIYSLNDHDMREIEKLADCKYSTWEWTYGNSPDFALWQELRFENGIIDIGLDVSSGIIEKIRIFGDFFGTGDIDEMTGFLTGLPFKRNAVKEALSRISLSDYIYNLSEELFIQCLFSNSAE